MIYASVKVVASPLGGLLFVKHWIHFPTPLILSLGQMACLPMFWKGNTIHTRNPRFNPPNYCKLINVLCTGDLFPSRCYFLRFFFTSPGCIWQLQRYHRPRFKSKREWHGVRPAKDGSLRKSSGIIHLTLPLFHGSLCVMGISPKWVKSLVNIEVYPSPMGIYRQSHSKPNVFFSPNI